MKNLLFAISMLFLFSCSSNTEKKADFSQMTFSLDTVMVDSKDEILNLKSGLWSSDFSTDKKYLYNFSSYDHSIEKIDLDLLEFVGRFPFEKEGPNGIGDYIGLIQYLPAERFYINSNLKNGIFNLQGVKVGDLNFKYEELQGDSLPIQNRLAYGFVFDEKPNQIIGVFRDWFNSETTFGILDVRQKTYLDKAIKEFDFLKNFTTVLNGDQGYPIAIIVPWVWANKENGKIIIGNNASSDLYIYDFASDSLWFETFESRLTANRKTGTYPAEAASKEEFDVLNKTFGEGITFMNPVWDPAKQVYFRFSFLQEFKEEEGKSVNEKAVVYLSILDQDFNLVSETVVDVLDKRPNFHFVKDGKIWIFENIDDEMAFIRLSIDSQE
ncbi:DUF4221 domain-containing protein [Aquiflexum sp. TKW24L]|uniref:DUF4221 family protein n=1 Tax=Aquiflexum sp. TKW24L TaxID=2942212 RepID=UPI0020BE8D0D|nr:DUF4221 family protein [Aquiflexum sp. TKW24L]MCL6258556.1 DUF4221 domain-containing protein [Aquiflexum sp. TKW24L]